MKKISLPQVYFCQHCNRYTDVNYTSDKFGDRPKSYCYKCSNETLKPTKILKDE